MDHPTTCPQGPALKFNGNQRYATTAITAAILREIASRCGVPLQVVYALQLDPVFCLTRKFFCPSGGASKE